MAAAVRKVNSGSPEPANGSNDAERGQFRAVHTIDNTIHEQIVLAENATLKLVTAPLAREEVRLNNRGLTIHTVRTVVTSCIPHDTLPIVLMHGLIAGVANWSLNIDELAHNRQVFAIDVLGFGQSSRFEFADHPKVVEHQYVQSIEEWREKQGLARFILLGHSMGGYLSCAYSLKYPQHVAHLILDDPWGFTESSQMMQKVGPVFMLESMWYLRGPRLMRETCMKFQYKSFQAFDAFHAGAGETFRNYLLAINQPVPATGEKAFSTLAMMFGLRAKIPMLKRLHQMDKNVGLTFLIGERSFLPHDYIYVLSKECSHLRYNVKIIRGADHEVHITQAAQFNEIVNKICDRVDYFNTVT